MIRHGGKRNLFGVFGNFVICGFRFVEVGLDRFANSPGLALAVGHPADVGRVKPQALCNAGEQSALCHVCAKESHCACHELDETLFALDCLFNIAHRR